MTEEEVTQYLNSKMNIDQQYTLFYLFGNAKSEHVEGVSGILKASFDANKQYIDFRQIPFLVVSLLVPYGFFATVYGTAFRKADNFTGKATAVLCLLFNIVPVLLCIFSSDYARWFSLGIIAQCMIIIPLIFYENKLITQGFELAVKILKSKPLLTAFLGYIALVYSIRWFT